MDSLNSVVRILFNLFQLWPDIQKASLPATSEPFGGCKDSTVIVGGGIVGLSTAYYLATAPYSSRLSGCISVVESSSSIFGAASGGATGILGDYGFDASAEALGILSWNLHRHLAEVYDGRTKWGFSEVAIHHLHNKSEERESEGSTYEKETLPSWLKDSEDYVAELAYGPDHAARIDPREFGRFLVERCEALGVHLYTNARATGLNTDQTNDLGTRFIEIFQDSERVLAPCHNIIVCAGPWSQRVLKSLFPNASYEIPMDVDDKAGNHFRVQTPLWMPEDDRNGTAQIYLQDVLGHSLDISSFLGGSLYVGGYGAEPEELPTSATDVHAQSNVIKEMIRLTERVLSLPDGASLEIFDVGRCYRPFVKQGRPIIARIPASKLSTSEHEKTAVGGVFLNVGHGADGITLGPGSGQVMSELVMGRQPSVDISGLGL